MTSDQIATIVENLIPILGGVYCTLLGFRTIGKKPGVDPKYDAYIEKYGKLMKILGPALIIYGLVFVIRSFL